MLEAFKIRFVNVSSYVITLNIFREGYYSGGPYSLIFVVTSERELQRAVGMFQWTMLWAYEYICLPIALG
jgi:hypothetical protein